MNWLGLGLPYATKTITEYIRIPGSGGAPVFLEHLPIIAPAEIHFEIVLVEERQGLEFEIILIKEKPLILTETNFMITLIEEEEVDMILLETENIMKIDIIEQIGVELA